MGRRTRDKTFSPTLLARTRLPLQIRKQQNRVEQRLHCLVFLQPERSRNHGKPGIAWIRGRESRTRSGEPINACVAQPGLAARRPRWAFSRSRTGLVGDADTASCSPRDYLSVAFGVVPACRSIGDSHHAGVIHAGDRLRPGLYEFPAYVALFPARAKHARMPLVLPTCTGMFPPRRAAWRLDSRETSSAMTTCQLLGPVTSDAGSVSVDGGREQSDENRGS